MGIIRISHPPGRPAERRYVFDLVFHEFLGLDYEAVADPGLNVIHIDLSAGGESRCLTVSDRLLQTPPADWLRPASLPTTPLVRWQPSLPVPLLVERDVPMLFGDSQAEPQHTRQHGMHLPLDVFGGIFFLVTRYEEIAATDRVVDAHGRFPARASLAGRERFLERPLADEYVAILWEFLARLRPGLQRKRTAYRLQVSHDVDQPFFGCGVPWPRVARGAAGDVFLRGRPFQALRRVVSRLTAAPSIDPANTFSFLMDHSERIGVRSEFNVMAPEIAGPLDASYALGAPEIRGLMRQIHGRGHVLGLHPSYDTYLDPRRTAVELSHMLRACEALDVHQDTWGGRQHFLRWRNPDTWQNWEAAGLAFDGSVGFADHVGFRSGTCHEHPVFNLRSGTPLRLRERPLVAMECTLLSDRYMGLAPDVALERISRLAETCRRFGGGFSLLWHNSELVDHHQRRLYVAALEAAR